jgi:serine/threonine protein kinase
VSHNDYILGLKYFVDCKICHRDLKPDNVLLSSKDIEKFKDKKEYALIKISDFGCSRFVGDDVYFKTIYLGNTGFF